MIRATAIVKTDDDPADVVTLSYENRFRRRIAMVGDNGLKFLLDLATATQLQGGDLLVLEDGRYILVIAADENLMRATGKSFQHLARAAWHIGNRHLPCEIGEDCIVLAYDHVIEDMLKKAGIKVERFQGPFNPEGGAYGQGRTHGHSH